MPNPRTFYKHRTQSSKLFAPTSNIRFDSPLGRPISLFRAQYGLWTPYCLRQYGLLGALLPAAIRALDALFRPFGLNTGFGRPIACGNTGFGAAIGARPIRRPILPGVALRSPRAVFWRPFRALAWIAIRLPQPRGCTSFTPTPGLHFVYPGLDSGAPSGRSHGLHFVYPNPGVALRGLYSGAPSGRS